MRTKKQYIELMQRYLSGGEVPVDVRKKYHEVIIDHYVGMAFAELVVDVYMANPFADKRSDLDTLTRAYTGNTIEPDSERGDYYVEIPVTSSKILQIPNNMAIRAVFPDGSPDERYYRREMTSNHVYSKLDVSTHITTPRWYVEGDKIRLSSKEDTVNDVTMQIVVQWEEYDDDDYVPMPLSRDMSILMKVVSLLREKPPSDKIIDANKDDDLIIKNTSR